MYKTLEISNYKAFDALRLEHLSRVNLIAGPNNVGNAPTALNTGSKLPCELRS